MPTPFPGMDPYLERASIWPDLHLNLIHAIQAALVPQVAPEYYVGVEERTYVVALEPNTCVGRPDVTAIGLSPETPGRASAGSATSIFPRPMTVELPMPDRVRQRYLEVRDGGTYEVVTAIEVLSPVNKRSGDGRQQYERKRQQVLDSLTSLVEIDLLRAWDPMPMHLVPSSHYRIVVSRSWDRPEAQLYPFNVNEAIPEIPVPLRAGEQEPTLNLNDLLNEVYDEIRYDLRIDYTTGLEPPLDPAVAAWSDELLRQAGRR